MVNIVQGGNHIISIELMFVYCDLTKLDDRVLAGMSDVESQVDRGNRASSTMLDDRGGHHVGRLGNGTFREVSAHNL